MKRKNVKTVGQTQIKLIFVTTLWTTHFFELRWNTLLEYCSFSHSLSHFTEKSSIHRLNNKPNINSNNSLFCCLSFNCERLLFAFAETAKHLFHLFSAHFYCLLNLARILWKKFKTFVFTCSFFFFDESMIKKSFQFRLGNGFEQNRTNKNNQSHTLWLIGKVTNE